MRTLLGLVILAGLGCCKPTASPTPGPDAADAAEGPADTAAACRALAAVPCAEGLASNCAVVLSKMVADNLNRDFHPHTVACLAKAQSVNDVHACGLTCTSP